MMIEMNSKFFDFRKKRQDIKRSMESLMIARDRIVAQLDNEDKTAPMAGASLGLQMSINTLPLEATQRIKETLETPTDGSPTLHLNNVVEQISGVIRAMGIKDTQMAKPILSLSCESIAETVVGLEKFLIKFKYLSDYYKNGVDSEGKTIRFEGTRPVNIRSVFETSKSKCSCGNPEVQSHYDHAELLETLIYTQSYYRDGIFSGTAINTIATASICAMDFLSGESKEFFVKRLNYNQKHGNVIGGRTHCKDNTLPMVESKSVSSMISSAYKPNMDEELSFPVKPCKIVDDTLELLSVIIEDHKGLLEVAAKLHEAIDAMTSAYPSLADKHLTNLDSFERLRSTCRGYVNEKESWSDVESCYGTIIYGIPEIYSMVAEHLSIVLSSMPIIMNYCLMKQTSVYSVQSS